MSGLLSIGRLQLVATRWLESPSANRYRLHEDEGDIVGAFFHWDLTLGPLHLRYWRKENEQMAAYSVLRPVPDERH